MVKTPLPRPSDHPTPHPSQTPHSEPTLQPHPHPQRGAVCLPAPHFRGIWGWTRISECGRAGDVGLGTRISEWNMQADLDRDQARARPTTQPPHPRPHPRRRTKKKSTRLPNPHPQCRGRCLPTHPARTRTRRAEEESTAPALLDVDVDLGTDAHLGMRTCRRRVSGHGGRGSRNANVHSDGLGAWGKRVSECERAGDVGLRMGNAHPGMEYASNHPTPDHIPNAVLRAYAAAQPTMQRAVPARTSCADAARRRRKHGTGTPRRGTWI
ncbi:hypothetical protein JB92DRAFT_2918335 [Gautieria morchelliformis]|nr:hypothetical protein JB92DRAFT_2918335 [Gautieria morchelliformis]